MERFGARVLQYVSASSRLLGWSPDQFWSATPSDFANALGGAEQEASMDRGSFEALRAMHPDKES